MIGFDNYKRTNFIMKILDLYYTIFNTRTKRIIFNSCSAFVVGIGIASAGLFITRNLHIQNGVGGLETSAVPEFNEADFEETVIAETELSENLAEAVIDDIENLEVKSDNLVFYPYYIIEDARTAPMDLKYFDIITNLQYRYDYSEVDPDHPNTLKDRSTMVEN